MATATATTPTSLLDLQAVLDAAYRNLGQVQADADYQQAQANQNLTRVLGESAQARGKATTRQRESDAGRGFLNSGMALTNQADVNQQYDQSNAGFQRTYDDLIHQLAAKRLGAQDSYSVAQTNYERQKAQMEADMKAKETLADPAAAAAAGAEDTLNRDYSYYGVTRDDVNDPNHWRLTDAKFKKYGLTPDASDPLNWRLIQAEQNDPDKKAYTVTSTTPRPNNQVNRIV